LPARLGFLGLWERQESADPLVLKGLLVHAVTLALRESRDLVVPRDDRAKQAVLDREVILAEASGVRRATVVCLVFPASRRQPTQ
jgi:hypothetical protein